MAPVIPSMIRECTCGIVMGNGREGLKSMPPVLQRMFIKTALRSLQIKGYLRDPDRIWIGERKLEYVLHKRT